MTIEKVKFAMEIASCCIQMSSHSYCVFCDSGNHDDNGNIVHEDDCVVLDAKKFLNIKE